MNLKAVVICVLLAGMVFVPGLRAQQKPPAQPQVQSRYLFVFDTSSTMKKRLPMEEKALHQLFAISLSGEFHPGDSIGLWVFNKDLRTGIFPLQHYRPQDAMTMPGEMAALLKEEHYSKSTRFDELIPMMNRLVDHSERLTVIIFCDGEGEMKGTTADDAINAEFKQNYSAMAKSKEPFVLIFRSQRGKFVGYTLSPADNITVPKFPPLPFLPPPTPVVATPVPTRAPAPAPAAPAPNAPPLIIIGSNVGTNPAARPTQPVVAPAPQSASTPTPSASATQQSSAVAPTAVFTPMSAPAPVQPAPETNPVPMTPVAASQPVATNAVVSMTEPAKPAFALTSAPSLPRESTIHVSLAVCGAFAVMAGAVVFLILRHSRTRYSTSLITESLKKR